MCMCLELICSFVSACLFMCLPAGLLVSLRYFPKIFGPNEDQPLDRDAAIAAFEKLTDEVMHTCSHVTSNLEGKVHLICGLNCPCEVYGRGVCSEFLSVCSHVLVW